jgi:hypothetical protein
LDECRDTQFDPRVVEATLDAARRGDFQLIRRSGETRIFEERESVRA